MSAQPVAQAAEARGTFGGDMDKGSGPVTLRMIADEVGVNVSTVSRVINSSDKEARRWASSDMIDRIRTVVAARGYQRNPHAASLRTRRSGLVGVLVPRLQDFVLATVYEGIEEAATEQGISTFVTNSLDRPENQASRTELMLSRRVDGLIFGDAHTGDPFLDTLAKRGIKFTLVSRRSGDHISATCDDIMGGRLVAEHLLATGRRDIGILSGRDYASTGNDRTAGVVQACLEAGIRIRPERIVHGGFDAPGGRQATERLLVQGGCPDAIFATNDFAAIGAMGVLRDRGITVPDDVAIVGYNDTPLAAELSIPLTTIHSPMHEMGRAGLNLLLAMLRGEPVESVRLAPELIVRASTAS
ncbi:LacI family DNA-binding transcriptional regulator [Paeniglutamicibacter sulfureus]|uniref:LacI family transcriptional regulator n=1 Tax=Paeniglutamicibacter sulfureus TaxID=43666 RepID=A0ABU2BJY3_9MICC|nr:substrate-binding domain-containing protein [Paeniglutamicibacter sulfureus]MDO2934360.1 substrate-binding domain-containing protein [Paeniglutamicibacter sulfureus]MDR7358556.1 LacI family transcriptional regulator [Paeniglutamicibacter sulfureus]